MRHSSASVLPSACDNARRRYVARMNLPTAARVIVDRTNETNHAPGELVLLVEAPGMEVAQRATRCPVHRLHRSRFCGSRSQAQLHVRGRAGADNKRCAGHDGELGSEWAAVVIDFLAATRSLADNIRMDEKPRTRGHFQFSLTGVLACVTTCSNCLRYLSALGVGRPIPRVGRHCDG